MTRGLIPSVENGTLTLEGKDNFGKPCQEYADKIMAMTDEQLSRETESKIWLSAYANNNPRSDYHWHSDVCYAVCKHRDSTGGMYQRAYDVVAKG